MSSSRLCHVSTRACVGHAAAGYLMRTMVTPDSDLQLFLDLVGVFAFALTGALVAVRRELDLVGVCVLAWVAGLGGGILRDLLIGATPPVGISDWRLVAVAVAAGLLVFFLYGLLQHPDVPRGARRATITRAVRLLDALGLAVFSIAGALKALSFGASPLAAVLIGAITACGGGLLRDLLAGQVPEVLRRELYAVPALIGAALVVWADATGHLGPPTIWGSVILVFTIRVVAVTLDLNAPHAFRTGDPT